MAFGQGAQYHLGPHHGQLQPHFITAPRAITQAPGPLKSARALVALFLAFLVASTCEPCALPTAAHHPLAPVPTFIYMVLGSVGAAVLRHFRLPVQQISSSSSQAAVSLSLWRGFAGGGYLDKTDVTQRVLDVAKHFEKVDPAKVWGDGTAQPLGRLWRARPSIAPVRSCGACICSRLAACSPLFVKNHALSDSMLARAPALPAHSPLGGNGARRQACPSGMVCMPAPCARLRAPHQNQPPMHTLLLNLWPLH